MTKDLKKELQDNNIGSPLEKRLSVSILLGAGFSVPQGYPTGKIVNELMQKFDDFPVDFAPSGELATSTNGEKPHFQAYGMNLYQKRFTFCKRLINEYAKVKGEFDYEAFYDFIRSQEIYQPQYQKICDDFVDEYNDYHSFATGIEPIYNQMVAYLIKDKSGKCWYDGEPHHIGYIENYDGFLNILSQWSNDRLINVHTLNHDMLFESFKKTDYLNGKISDGFDEFGSPYYGILEKRNVHYHVRLERYTGRYNTSVRLYKLHGSLDYVLYYRTKDSVMLIPDKYVKIQHGIGPGYLIKARRSKVGYETFPFAMHSDFLTGTTTKIFRYREPLLYRKLFKKFKKNLEKAEILLIAGYGFKDTKINEIILNKFNYQLKPVIIIDPFPSCETKEFALRTKAKILEKSIADITTTDIPKI
jgi:hypothetical protein BACCOPRO_01635